MSRSLQASALTFAVLSIGHTLGGREWTAEKAFKAIKGSKSWACGTVGWYQGSAFFLLTGILHYQWSRNPVLLHDPLNQAMAGIVNVLLWCSSAWYSKHGVNDNAVAVAAAAALQGGAVLKQIL